MRRRQATGTVRLASRMASAAWSLAFVAGVALAAAPIASDLQSTRTSQQVISQMSSSIDRTDDPSRQAVLREAQAYNQMLGGTGARVCNDGLQGNNGEEADVMTLVHAGDETTVAYQDQLVWNDVAALCWLEIPTLALAEPVYHGTSDDVLAQGVGHLDWSSLPVGGLSSHCVLAAHSGMEESQMFDGLERLEEGDLIVLHTLGDAYAYRVYECEVVVPRDAESRCAIQEGRDLCTLMTCTPYGINTHRLLVHAERVAFELEASQTTPLTTYVNRRTMPMLGIAGMLGAAGISSVGTFVVARVRMRKRRDSRRTTPGYHHRTHPHPTG